MDHNQQEQVAVHRWAVIAEAAGDKLTARERGALVRQIAARAHPHPDGSSRRYSRGTIDRWLRAWRKGGGLAALKPAERADTGVVRAHPVTTITLASSFTWSPPDGTSLYAQAQRSLSGNPSYGCSQVFATGRIQGYFRPPPKGLRALLGRW